MATERSLGLVVSTLPAAVGYAVAPEVVFSSIAHEPGAVWLDSALSVGDRGRRSFVARRPVLSASLTGGRITVARTGEVRRVVFPGDVGDLLALVEKHPALFAVGYIGYEAAAALLGQTDRDESGGLPRACFLFYEAAACFDHRTRCWSSTNAAADGYGDLLVAREAAEPPARVRLESIAPAVSADEYLDSVDTVLHHIREGDIYQANYTTRITVHSGQDPYGTYLRLRQLSPAPYAAYLNFGDYRVLSSSPERMLRRRGRRVTSGPIKGTIARGLGGREDARSRRVLLGSTKDRAELLMIVDLIRNDLGRVAEIGSVTVDSLFRTETYASLIHLVGDVSARLKPGAGLRDVLCALLPGGSITGAPKRRAVEILRGLERVPRSVYTGVIGYSYGDEADFNIAIRTMTYQKGEYHLHAGGGIVADSTPEREYAEMMLKARNMLRALGAWTTAG